MRRWCWLRGWWSGRKRKGRPVGSKHWLVQVDIGGSDFVMVLEAESGDDAIRELFGRYLNTGGLERYTVSVKRVSTAKVGS
jgi:hypothetical protein